MTAPDPRVTRLLRALAKEPAIAPSVDDYLARRDSGSGSFGRNALKAGSKMFALFTQGTLVVKLPKARVAALVAAGAGTHFDPGHGRKMTEWLVVTGTRPSWLALAREAFTYVAGL